MSPKLTPEFCIEVAEKIKAELLSGRFMPGDRLPSYSEILKTIPYSRITIRGAVELLKEQGFIVGKERCGLFVHDHPPHLSRIGFVLPDNEARSLHWATMVSLAPAVAKKIGCACTIYRNTHRGELNFGDRPSLLRDASQNLLAGFFFAYGPPDWPELHTIPKVGFSCVDYPNGGRIDLDWDSFAKQAVARLRAANKSKIALIGLGEAPILVAIERELAHAGITVPPAWRLTTGHPPIGGVAIAQLLMSLPKKQRPDGIILVDDDITEPVTRGILQSGNYDPSILVLSHANYPVLPQTAFPIEFIGYDLEAVLRAGFQMILSMRMNRPTERIIRIAIKV